MSEARAGARVLGMRGVEKTWSGSDRSFTLRVHAFDLAAGEVVALVGASGSGKSTFLEIAGLATRPDRAAAFTMGGAGGPADAGRMHARRDSRGLAALRARRIGFVLQTGALLPFLTVAENVRLAQSLAGRGTPREADALLGRLGLAAAARAYPAELSVGQRQRAAIARAVAHRPAIVLADEPTAALDPPNKDRVVELFLELAADLGAAVVVATHEAQAVAGRAHRTVRVATAVTEDGLRDHVVAELSEAA